MTTDELAPQLISVFPVTCILRLFLASGSVMNCEDKAISYKKYKKKPESRKARHHQIVNIWQPRNKKTTTKLAEPNRNRNSIYGAMQAIRDIV